jgi:deoxyribose-phosphate aldolase
VTAPSPSELSGITEFTLAGAAVTAKELEDICRQAGGQKLYGVCVASSRVELAASFLADTDLKVTALVGGPLGTSDGDVKRYETEVAVDYGAQEIEVILNSGRLKDGDHKYVLRELRDVAEAADERIVKANLQTRLLTREEIVLGCELILDSGAHFVCATFASLEDIKLFRETVGPKFGVKAEAPTLDAASAQALVAAGATRLGIFAAFPSQPA